MRLIDADKLKRQEFDGDEYCFDYVDAEDIDNAPTVDAVEVVHGVWAPVNRIDPLSGYRCVKCRHIVGFDLTPYCPNCGAKMDGGDNAEG